MKKILLTLALCLFTLPVYAGSPLGPGGCAALSSKISSAQEASHVFATAQANLCQFSITTAGTAGYVLVYDATTAPSDGTVAPKACYQVSANNTTGFSYISSPLYTSTGLVMVFSSTGCFTQTSSATAVFSAQVQ